MAFIAFCLVTFYIMAVISFVGICLREREYQQINFPGLRKAIEPSAPRVAILTHASPNDVII